MTATILVVDDEPDLEAKPRSPAGLTGQKGSERQWQR